MTLEQLETAWAALPAVTDVPLSWTVGQLTAHEERRRILTSKIHSARANSRALAEVDPQIAALTTQRDDLTTIRQECCDDLLAIRPHSRDRADGVKLQGLKISILTIDGRFDLRGELYPTPLPLFEKLKARGYVAPAHASWNPLAACFGSLPTIERRLADLQKRRDEAQHQLDLVLRDPVPV